MKFVILLMVVYNLIGINNEKDFDRAKAYISKSGHVFFQQQKPFSRYKIISLTDNHEILLKEKQSVFYKLKRSDTCNLQYNWSFLDSNNCINSEANSFNDLVNEYQFHQITADSTITLTIKYSKIGKTRQFDSWFEDTMSYDQYKAIVFLGSEKVHELMFLTTKFSTTGVEYQVYHYQNLFFIKGMLNTWVYIDKFNGYSHCYPLEVVWSESK